MNTIKINQVEKGSHGINWHAIFDENADQSFMINRFVKTIETGHKQLVNPTTIIVTDSLMRGIIQHKSIISGFPYLKGVHYNTLTVGSITEWSASSNLEAVIKASHATGPAVYFFATDYAINQHVYKNQNPLSINIIGLIYDVVDFNPEEWNDPSRLTFDKDFCGYLPVSEDEIEFFGRIQKITAHTLDNVEGFLLLILITPELSIEFFIAEKKLSIELTVNKSIRGIAWLQGTLE